MKKYSRRDMLKASAMSVAGYYAATRLHFIEKAYGAFIGPQTPLAGSAIPQFVDPLPLLSSHVTGGAIQLSLNCGRRNGCCEVARPASDSTTTTMLKVSAILRAVMIE